MSRRTTVLRTIAAIPALALVVAAGACGATEAPAGAGAAATGSSAAPSSATPSSGSPSAAGTTTPGATSEPGLPTPAGPSASPVTAVDPAPVTSGGDLQVALTYVSWFAEPGGVDASGVVAGVVESGGTCTLSLVRSGVTVQATTTGLADASSTSCGTLSVPAAELSAGVWQATLSYASGAGTATSAVTTVEVPTP